MDCATCKFFKPKVGKYVDWCGECHRYPPKLNEAIIARRQEQLDRECGDRDHPIQFDDLIDYSFYPVVEEAGFCGEHQIAE